MGYTNKNKQREYQTQWLAKRRQAWIDSQGGACTSCGSNDDLEVDHINPSTKTMNPRSIWSRRQEVRDKELAKCQVLCEKCHQIKSKAESSTLNLGSRNPKAKLNEEDVILIKKLLSEGLKYPEIAQKFSVSNDLIGNIARGERWSQIKLPASGSNGAHSG